MTGPDADEPPIEAPHQHHLEERALEILRERAEGEAQAQVVERLSSLREKLMVAREAWNREARAARHARGEVYTAARVAKINAMQPTREQWEESIRDAYLPAPGFLGVLKVHAKFHFGAQAATLRMIRGTTPAARALQAADDAFAKAWIEAIGDEGFAASLRREARGARLEQRSPTRPIFFATVPPSLSLEDGEAAALGKAWTQLDRLASKLGVDLPSHFLALPDENAPEDGAPVATVLSTVRALTRALALPAHQVPGKRAVAQALGKVRAALEALPADARASFEMDL